MGAERVFVVRRADFFAGSWPQGLTPLSKEAGCELVQEFEARGFLVDRGEAEENPAWQQPIPYVLLTCGSQTFCVRRRKRGTEGRLHGLYSVGIGGHVGPEDLGEAGKGASGAMEACLKRELTEELVIPREILGQARLVGLLKDDESPVGRVHAGLVYRLQLTETLARKVAVREISKLAGGFTPLVELKNLWQDPLRFETWSQIVLEDLVLPRRSQGIADNALGAHAREEHNDGG